MALLIDTEHVRPQRRASHFLDAVTTSPLPASDWSNSRFEADDFRARFHIRPLGDAYLADVLATGLQLNRSRREIDRKPCGQVLIALINRGSCKEGIEGGPILVPEAGDLLLLDLDGPQTATFDCLTSATCAYIPAGTSGHSFRIIQGWGRLSSARATNSTGCSRPAWSRARRRKA